MKVLFFFVITIFLFSCENNLNNSNVSNTTDSENIVPSATGSGSIVVDFLEATISWEVADNAEFYELWYNEYYLWGDSVPSTESQTVSDNKTILLDGEVFGTEYFVNNLEGNKSYYFFVRSRNGENFSDFTYVGSFTPYQANITVTFDPGEAVSGDVPLPVTQSNYKNKTILGSYNRNNGFLIGPLFNERYHQIFDHWNTKSDGSGVKIGPERSTYVSCDITLYAIFTNDDSIIGKIGPGGGIVAYDDEEDGVDDIEGFRYIEFYIETLSTHEWGENFLTIEESYAIDSQELGDGLINTNYINDNYDINNFPAFKACLDFSNNGYSDWYLPSMTELDLLRTYYYYDYWIKVPFDRKSGTNFWTSSGGSFTHFLDTSRVYNNLGPDHLNEPRTAELYVRPFRSFN